MYRRILLYVISLGAILGPTEPTRAGVQTPLGTAFTYQGQLKDGGIPADGDYDMMFSLFDAANGGSAVDATLVFDGAGGNAPPVVVVNGLFTVALDFDDLQAFDGRALWLQVEVQPHGTTGYTTLTPRQALTAAPYALGLQLPFTGAIESLPLGANMFTLTNRAGAGSATVIRNNSATNASPALEVRAPSGAVAPAAELRGEHTAVNGEGVLEVISSDTFNPFESLRLDGFGIDKDSGPLHLQSNTSGDIMMVGGGGHVGINEDSPQSQLHVQLAELGIDHLHDDALSNDDIIVEDSDAVIGIYSSGAGTRGSALVLGEVASNGALVDKWALGRNTSDTGGALYVKYGTDPSYGNNATMMVIDTDGDVGFGLSAPTAKLHVDGGTDASATGTGGYIVAGSTNGTNVSIDNNEIMARNNGAPATLFLNNDGGDVNIGGTLDIDYQVITYTPGVDWNLITVLCPAGKKVLSGGCVACAGFAGDVASYPIPDGSGWYCDLPGLSNTCVAGTGYVICAKVK